MMKRRLGKTGFDVSPVIYGGIVSKKDGQENSDRYVAWAIDRGVNYFDVAPSYDDAQEKLGHSLLPYRKSIHLACKTACREKDAAEKDFIESMRLLHTDYFDNYQIHSLESPEDVDAAFAPNGVMEMMVRHKAAGDVRHLGITCHSEEAALKAITLYDFDTVLFPLNWHLHIGQGFGSTIVKTAKAMDMGVLAMKVLILRRWFSDEEKLRSASPKSWCKPIDPENTALRLAAMKYTLSLGPDTMIPPGNFADFSFMADHIDEVIANPLSQEDRILLKAAFEKVGDYPFLPL
jgi:aryl-alcohol dehydrogenase-like predicted oxidoreductase